MANRFPVDRCRPAYKWHLWRRITGPTPNQRTRRGLAPTEAKEAAIYQALSPGIYTATVTGKNSSVGVGLVEVYRLP
jgi:hypothetical protein